MAGATSLKADRASERTRQRERERQLKSGKDDAELFRMQVKTNLNSTNGTDSEMTANSKYN